MSSNNVVPIPTSQSEIALPPDPPTSAPIVCDRLSGVGGILDRLACQSVFLVADPVAYEQSGASCMLKQILASRRVATFCEFRPNPCLETLQNGIERYRVAKPDIILAVGGGTAIDLAKLIGFCAVQTDDPVDCIKSPPVNPRRRIPLVVAPTTAGTGSEATQFAVVYVDGRKYSLAHDDLLPDYAIVDASLTESMPSGITAETGLDALCQAIESMWSIRSTDESIGYATEAIRLAWRHLPAAVQHPQQADRRAMCRAAHLAGKAINISRTTAPHAISYTITSKFGVPHGRAVALTLGAILAFNHEVTEADCNDPRGADHVQKTIDDIAHLIGCKTVDDAPQSIRKFMASLDCPTRLTDVGVTTDAQIDQIVEQVNVQRLANNPRRLASESLRVILQSIR